MCFNAIDRDLAFACDVMQVIDTGIASACYVMHVYRVEGWLMVQCFAAAADVSAACSVVLV